MGLIDLVVTVHDRLDQAGVAHAFGGALALAYVAEPRGTVDRVARLRSLLRPESPHP